jgi:hypothetical protein
MRAVLAAATGACLLAIAATPQGQTATITGKVRDITGAVISGATAEISSQISGTLKTTADDAGVYQFSGLAPGQYTLRLFRAGFASLTVKASVSAGEAKILPSFELTVAGSTCDHRGQPWFDDIRVLSDGMQTGNLGGTVIALSSPTTRRQAPIKGAEVTLFCASGQVCGKTKTDSSGEFLFAEIAPGKYSVMVNHAGFYPWRESGYSVQPSLQTDWSLYVEACPRGNCDPRLRPQKPLGVCE